MKMLSNLPLVAASLPTALACLGYEGGVPKPTASHSNSAVIEIAAGQVFDGGWAKYDRGSGACNGQKERDWKDAVFYLHSGATLRNVIIGKNQDEGVHCDGPCTLEFVWFEDVCEDAISVKNDKAGQETWIIGGGAYHASDKVIQHNGCGTVNVSHLQAGCYIVLRYQPVGLHIINYYVKDYGKLYRSCGNCSKQCKRNVYVEGVTARNGGELVGINANYGDTATLKNVCTDTETPCQMYSGCAGGCEPKKVGTCSG